MTYRLLYINGSMDLPRRQLVVRQAVYLSQCEKIQVSFSVCVYLSSLNFVEI